MFSSNYHSQPKRFHLFVVVKRIKNKCSKFIFEKL